MVPPVKAKRTNHKKRRSAVARNRKKLGLRLSKNTFFRNQS
jgi:hypothetical protein